MKFQESQEKSGFQGRGLGCDLFHLYYHSVVSFPSLPFPFVTVPWNGLCGSQGYTTPGFTLHLCCSAPYILMSSDWPRVTSNQLLLQKLCRGHDLRKGAPCVFVRQAQQGRRAGGVSGFIFRISLTQASGLSLGVIQFL